MRLTYTVLQALVRSTEYHHNQLSHNASLSTVFACTTGIIFLGTPHRGSSKASLARLIARVIRGVDASERLLNTLEVNADILERERNSFDTLRRDLFVACLYEELPMPFVGMVCNRAEFFVLGPALTSCRLSPRSPRESMAHTCSRSRF